MARRHARRRACTARFATPPGGVGQRLERGADERESSLEIAEHELRAEADDAEARALELAIATRIRGRLARVNGAIDFNDELDAGR